MFSLQVRHNGFLQSEGFPHYPLEANLPFGRKISKKIKPTEEKFSSMGLGGFNGLYFCTLKP